MEQEYKWNPQTKFGPQCHSMHLNHSKLIGNTIAKCSVKYQHTTQQRNKVMAIEWY